MKDNLGETYCSEFTDLDEASYIFVRYFTSTCPNSFADSTFLIRSLFSVTTSG